MKSRAQFRYTMEIEGKTEVRTRRWSCGQKAIQV